MQVSYSSVVSIVIELVYLKWKQQAPFVHFAIAFFGGFVLSLKHHNQQWLCRPYNPLLYIWPSYLQNKLFCDIQLWKIKVYAHFERQTLGSLFLVVPSPSHIWIKFLRGTFSFYTDRYQASFNVSSFVQNILKGRVRQCHFFWHLTPDLKRDDGRHQAVEY